MQLAEPGSQKTYQSQESAGPRGRDGGHGRKSGRSSDTQDPLLHAPTSLVGRACACMCVPNRGVVRVWSALAWTRSIDSAVAA
jgi:hypothetical protein